MPAHDDAQWQYVQKDPEKSKITCGWQTAKVYVGFVKELQKKSPKAYQFFKQWSIPIAEVNAMISDLEDIPGNPKKEAAGVAKQWIKNHPDLVDGWIKGIQ